MMNTKLSVTVSIVYNKIVSLWWSRRWRRSTLLSRWSWSGFVTPIANSYMSQICFSLPFSLELSINDDCYNVSSIFNFFTHFCFGFSFCTVLVPINVVPSPTQVRKILRIIFWRCLLEDNATNVIMTAIRVHNHKSLSQNYLMLVSLCPT